MVSSVRRGLSHEGAMAFFPVDGMSLVCLLAADDGFAAEE